MLSTKTTCFLLDVEKYIPTHSYGVTPALPDTDTPPSPCLAAPCQGDRQENINEVALALPPHRAASGREESCSGCEGVGSGKGKAEVTAGPGGDSEVKNGWRRGEG